jgi:hypothetical protein
MIRKSRETNEQNSITHQSEVVMLDRKKKRNAYTKLRSIMNWASSNAIIIRK